MFLFFNIRPIFPEEKFSLSTICIDRSSFYTTLTSTPLSVRRYGMVSCVFIYSGNDNIDDI